MPSTVSWCRKVPGPGLVRDAIIPAAQGWRLITSRAENARSRIAVRQYGSAAPDAAAPDAADPDDAAGSGGWTGGSSISANTASTIASSSASLFATWW